MTPNPFTRHIKPLGVHLAVVDTTSLHQAPAGREHRTVTNLQPGFKLLGTDASWTVVVSIEIEAEPLEAYDSKARELSTSYQRVDLGVIAFGVQLVL